MSIGGNTFSTVVSEYRFLSLIPRLIAWQYPEKLAARWLTPPGLNVSIRSFGRLRLDCYPLTPDASERRERNGEICAISQYWIAKSFQSNEPILLQFQHDQTLGDRIRQGNGRMICRINRKDMQISHLVCYELMIGVGTLRVNEVMTIYQCGK